MRAESVKMGWFDGEIRPSDAHAMGCAVVGVTGVLWLSEGVLVLWEILRFGQNDKPGRGCGHLFNTNRTGILTLH